MPKPTATARRGPSSGPSSTPASPQTSKPAQATPWRNSPRPSRDYATREGYEVLEEVVDPGQSGASLERPGMDRVRDLVAAAGLGRASTGP